MDEEKPAHVGIAGKLVLEPAALRRFLGEAGVDDLGVDDDEAAAFVLERVEIPAEVLLPERQRLVRDHGRRTPGHGLVADVVVAGNEMQRTGKPAAELQEPFGGGGVGRLGGDRVDQVPEMDGERGARCVDGLEGVARAGIGQRRTRKRRGGNPFRFVHMGVGDYRKGEKTLAADPHRCRARAGIRSCHAGASRFGW